jgi:hypothetical protein
MVDTARAARSSSSFTATRNTLSTSSEIISAANELRSRILVKNLDASIVVYVGEATGVTSSTGFPLAAGESVALYTTAVVYAIAASGTPAIAIVEETI